MEDGAEKKDAVLLSRLRYRAVKLLGYTHTEYGMRKMNRIIGEIADATAGTEKVEQDSLSWMDEEVI